MATASRARDSLDDLLSERCPRCQRMLRRDARLCGHCGRRLSWYYEGGQPEPFWRLLATGSWLAVLLVALMIAAQWLAQTYGWVAPSGPGLP